MRLDQRMDMIMSNIFRKKYFAWFEELDPETSLTQLFKDKIWQVCDFLLFYRCALRQSKYYHSLRISRFYYIPTLSPTNKISIF